jgi:hypothetical protein
VIAHATTPLAYVDDEAAIRAGWLRIVREGSRTTATIRKCSQMSRWPPIAESQLHQQHCGRPLFAVDALLTKKDLQAIGAKVMPKILRKQRVVGGHDRGEIKKEDQ